MNPAGGPHIHQVTVENAKRVVAVPDNANLREVCLREGIPLYLGPARLLNCGGRARCGTCLVRVLEGPGNLSPPTPFERRRLPETVLWRRLACQANVRGPVCLDTRG